MGLSNQEIEEKINLIGSIILQKSTPPSRERSDEEMRMVAAAGLQLLCTALQALQDVAIQLAGIESNTRGR